MARKSSLDPRANDIKKWLFEDGLTRAQIARQLGVSSAEVSRWLTIRRVAPKTQDRNSKLTKLTGQIKTMFFAGMTQAEIAYFAEVEQPTISNFINARGWKRKMKRKSQLDAKRDQVLAELEKGATLAQIAETMGVADQVVRWWVNKHDIPYTRAKRGRLPFLEAHTDQVKCLYDQGLTMKEIAKQMGRAPSTVGRFVVSKGWKRKRPNATPTMDNLRRNAQQIKILFDNYSSLKDIAEKFNVSYRSLVLFIKAQGWQREITTPRSHRLDPHALDIMLALRMQDQTVAQIAKSLGCSKNILAGWLVSRGHFVLKEGV